MRKPELVLDAKAILGEGPSWDETRNVLYWVDILGMEVHIYDPITQTDRAIPTGQHVGAVVPGKNKRAVVALKSGFFELDLESGELTRKTEDLEPHLPGNRFNDGKCDAAGRFWAGTMDMSERALSGSLYCMDTDGSVRKVEEGIGISNGIAWDSENKTMYYIDTMQRMVAAYDFDLTTGTIRNKRMVVDFSNEAGFPDGMTIDDEGMLWVAHWDGYQVSRWHPQTGKKLESIILPVARVTSCTFGGKHRNELYITTARHNGIAGEYENQPHAGGLFRVELPVIGTPTYSFGV